MSDPLGSIGSPELGILLAIALAALCSAARLLQAVGPLDPEVPPIKLELPLRTSKAKKLVEDWEKSRELGAVRRWVYADFPFLLCYGAALAAVGSLAGRAAGDARLGAVFVWAGLAAPLFDVLEDLGMLRMLRKHFGQPLPAATTVVSAIKWVLALGVGVGSLGVLVVSAVDALT